MFRYLTGAIKLINFGYLKVMATASTTLPSIQSPTSSVQGEHRHVSRKRKQDMPSSAAHNGVTLSSSTVAHNGITVSSSSGAHSGITVSPSSATYNGVNVTPSSATHNGINVTPSSAPHIGANVTPSSATHNGINVTPSSAPYIGANVTPSSAPHNGVNETPSSEPHNSVNVTPSSAAYNASNVTPSSVANQDSHGRMTQVNTKSLQASISAVVSFNFPEDIVKRCAEDMLNQGKSVTALTLLQECESRYSPEFQQPCSYSEKIRNNNSENNDLYESFIGATSLPADLNEGSSLPTTNTDSGFSPNGSHPATSRHTYREERGESRLNGSVESTVANQTSHSTPSVSAQSRGPPDVGEDEVDGHLSSLYVGLNGSAQADDADSSTMFSQSITGDISSPGLVNTSSSVRSGLHNGLSRSVNEISFSDNTEGDAGSLKQHKYGESGISTNNSGSSRSYTHSSSSDVGNLAVLSRNSTEQAAEQPRRGSTATAKHSSTKTAEYMNTCFRLVEREHELLEKSRKCSQCFEKPREVTFLPCGHFTVCRQCAEPIYVCPSCNKSVLATVDTYLS